MLYPINLSSSFLSMFQNAIIMNESMLKKNLDLEDLNLDLSNPETLKLYKMNLELKYINTKVDYLIYKLVCLFNFLLSKKIDIQLLIT
jgi:hypothetical protein|uniref:Uncharacterized protein n=1 Tax=viral metagenome TaxID=1070528 RepID=A0A6C0CEM9_9ZZZZ